MTLDRDGVTKLFVALGSALSRPTILCLIGSTPAILLGQPSRQTQDIDVWNAGSDYDTGDLSQACDVAGLLFDPKGAVSPDTAYLQIVRPGIVSLPAELEPETIGVFGMLKVSMPKASVLAAAKLTRGSERDLEDVAWWVRNRALDGDEVRASISSLPRASDREAAAENIVLVALVASGNAS